jgi:hypothetical protein
MDAIASSGARRRVGLDPNKSRITNGRDLLPGDVDGRSAQARRFRDIVNAVLSDQGGVDRCSESKLQLVRRFAAAAVLAEQLESRLVLGEAIDINQHSLLCSTMVRISQRIGITRVPRNVTPSLSEYLALRGELTGESSPANGKSSPLASARSPEGTP